MTTKPSPKQAGVPVTLGVAELLREVMNIHADPASYEYNDCDKTKCWWCECAEAALAKQASIDEWNAVLSPTGNMVSPSGAGQSGEVEGLIARLDSMVDYCRGRFLDSADPQKLFRAVTNLRDHCYAALRAQGAGEPVAWTARKDTSEPPEWESPQMEEWQGAIEWTTLQLADMLGVKNYDADAATETLDGDTKAIMWHILQAAGVVNEETGELYTAHPVISAAELTKLQQHMGMEAPSERMMREINALRGREERLRELAKRWRARYNPNIGDMIAAADELESILNEGKT